MIMLVPSRRREDPQPLKEGAIVKEVRISLLRSTRPEDALRESYEEFVAVQKNNTNWIVTRDV